MERIASKELSERKKTEARRRVEGKFVKQRWSQFERRARAAANKRGKLLGSSAIQQIREAHPMRESTRPDQAAFNLRDQLSQRNESRNSNNSARYLRKEDERTAVIERPLTSSTPGPRQKTPEMNLADIIEGHKLNVHGPAKKGRRSYIPSQAQVRKEDEKTYGGKRENEERIRRNREKNEQRLKELEIVRMQEELERKKWEWARDMRSPSPGRPDSRL